MILLRSAIAGLASAALLPVVWSSVASAELPIEEGPNHLGVAECASAMCHGALFTGEGDGNLRLDEYRSWLRHDPHAQAYRVLLNARSKRIARNLGITAPERDDLCLDCHATNVDQSRRGERFHLSDGVTCEACHGGAEPWIDSHAKGSSREKNLAAGMYPTEDVVKRAELCLSCHLGTADQFVSHRIMAAGHPRMSFELETFTQLQSHYEVDDDYRRRKAQPSGARTWALGEIVAARAYLELFQEKTQPGGWPEFGVFDCYSCHQPIRNPLLSSEVGRVEHALPRMREHSLEASLDIVRVVAPSELPEFQDTLESLVAKVAAGDSGSLAGASKLRDLLALVLPKVGAWKPSLAETRALTRALAGRYATRTPLSYSQADQATMAIQAVSVELLMAPRGEPVRANLGRLFDATAEDSTFDADAFRREMQTLRASLEHMG